MITKIKEVIMKLYQSVLSSIEVQEQQYHLGTLSRFTRVIIHFRLFFLYLLVGIIRSGQLLFRSSPKSFDHVSPRKFNGTFGESYAGYVRFQKKVRLFSFSSFMVLVVASFALFHITQWIFPSQSIQAVYAADNTFTVVNKNDSGFGSLRQAITNANGASGSVEIVFNIVGASNLITLSSALPDLTAPVQFTNDEVLPIIVDGGGLSAGTDCFEIASGAEGTIVVGMAFRYCPGSGLVVSASDTVDIGGVAVSDNVYAYGSGEYGIDFGASDSTISSVYLGYPLSNATAGLRVSGDSNTITGVIALNNIGYGIHIASGAESNTIQNSYIGVRTTLSSGDVGNDSHGIYIEGDTTTIGGTQGTGNVISDNGGNGVYVASGVTSIIIADNIIGLNEDEDESKGNSASGVYLNAVANTQVSNNTIASNTVNGITVVGGSNIDITANNIGNDGNNTNFGNGEYGVDVSGGTSGVQIGNGSESGVNILSYNGSGAILISGSSTFGVQASQNNFANSNLKITIEDDANQGIQPMEITGAGSGIIRGFATTPPLTVGSTVEVYINGVYIDSTTTTNTAGDWTIAPASGQNFDAYDGEDVSVILIEGSNTSEFSDTYPLTIVPKTMAVTDSASFTDAVTVTASLENDDGTIYYTTDGTTPTIASSSESSPLTLTFTETTTLQVMGQDVNDNLTEVQTETYTLVEDTEDTPEDETEEDPEDETDPGSEDDDTTVEEGDNAGDGQDNESTTTVSIGNYLQPQNVKINGLQVYSKTKKIYVPFNSVNIVGINAKNTQEVRAIVRKANGDAIDADWTEVKNQTWKRTVSTTLTKGNTYTVHAKARLVDQLSRESSVKQLATIVASNPAPTIVSLNGAYAVTARPDQLVFSGLYQKQFDSAVFKVRDEATGIDVAQCTVIDGATDGQTTNGACSLDETLDPGQYILLFQSLDGSLLSAPDDTHLIVTNPITRSVLNLDSRSEQYDDRITTDSSPKLVGVGPENSTGKVYLNGALVGSVDFISAVGWEYELDLSAQQRGKDYLVEVRFTNTTSLREVQDYYLYYPFKYAYGVVNPQVRETVPLFVEKGAPFTLPIAGGAHNTIRMLRNGTVLGSDLFDQNVDGSVGFVTISLPTDTIGDQKIDIETEDSVGLSSTGVSIVYTVVETIAEAIQEQVAEAIEEQQPDTEDEDTDTTPEQTDGGNTNRDANTDQPDTDTDTDTDTEPEPENTNTNSGDTKEPVADSNGNNIADDVEESTDVVFVGELTDEGIPTEWRTSPITDEEVQQIKERLDTLNSRETVQFDAVTLILDSNGRVVGTEVIEFTADGLRVFRKQTITGIKVFPALDALGNRNQSDMIFSGQTDPYALVRLIIRSDPVVRITRANEKGEWKIAVAADVLPPGEHTASIQTESKGVVSDEVEIAKFVVIEEEQLSNSTILFIVNMAVVVLVLVTSVAMQLRRRRATPKV